jgi:hypothetical protein
MAMTNAEADGTKQQDHIRMKAAWEGERFEQILNTPMWSVSDLGPLRGPVLAFTVRRTDDHQIEMLTISETPFPAVPQLVEPMVTGPRAGTVQPAKDVVELSGPTGTVILGGVVPFSLSSTSDFARKTTRYEQRSLVHSILQSPNANDVVGFQFEWINNAELHGPLPHSFNVKDKETSVISFPGGQQSIEIRSSSSGSNYGHCYQITIEDSEIIFGEVPSSSYRSKLGQAYILYQGQAPAEFRRKFRECLSYAFGRPMIYLGYSLLTTDSVQCGFEVVAGFNADHARYAYVGLPPAPLFEGRYIMVNERVTTRLLKGLFTHYDALNFLHVSWLYWHGLCSALHSQAVQMGAAIEALQAAHATAYPNAYNTKLMSRGNFLSLKRGVEALVNQLSIDNSVKAELGKKVENLNSPSQRLINERFFEALKLPMGSEEIQAWSRRNDAAHGTGTEDYHGVIKDIKLLMNIFARIVLRISGGSDCYVDYYTPGFPVRKLEEPVSSTNPHLGFTQPY